MRWWAERPWLKTTAGVDVGQGMRADQALFAGCLASDAVPGGKCYCEGEATFMSTQPKTLLTEEQYLEIERAAETKSEFFQGEMFAMAGAGAAHNRLAWNLIVQLGPRLGSGPCQGFPSDMRVRVPSSGLYTYPDVVVVCGEPQFLDGRRDTLLNPNLIVEVLSPSTEAHDRGRKFEHYVSSPRSTNTFWWLRTGSTWTCMPGKPRDSGSSHPPADRMARWTSRAWDAA